jgi:nucleoside-diphosphate-sugar epimerase
MRVLFIGGTGMTAPFAVRDLIAAGHDVWLMHRSANRPLLTRGASHIQADKADLPRLRERLQALGLDVVVHMVAYTEADAAAFADLLPAIAKHAVVISSADVYRAYGRIHRTEPGPPDDAPLDEDAPLRTKLSIHGPQYDKVAVERIVQSNPKAPCTILRYPAVYGPGDRSHRLRGWVKRMDDGRSFILMSQSQANWRFTHGYVENVAAALVSAIIHPAASGRIYNIGEEDTPTWMQFVERVGAVVSWKGRVQPIPGKQLPAHLADDLDFRQDWTLDTSRIRSELGHHETVGPTEALERTVAWERSGEGTIDPKEFNYAAEDAAASSVSSEN